jgi:hypothetical protein
MLDVKARLEFFRNGRRATLNVSPISVIVASIDNQIGDARPYNMSWINSNGRRVLTRARLKYILIGDATMETCDICISVLRVDASRLCLSHVVIEK